MEGSVGAAGPQGVKATGGAGGTQRVDISTSSGKRSLSAALLFLSGEEAKVILAAIEKWDGRSSLSVAIPNSGALLGRASKPLKPENLNAILRELIPPPKCSSDICD